MRKDFRVDWLRFAHAESGARAARTKGVIWKLDPLWLMMAVASVSVLGYFLGNALDAVMRHDGFGAFGNMFLFIAGFFGAVYLANSEGIVLRGLAHAATVGLGGAFVLIAVLAGCKAAISRLPR